MPYPWYHFWMSGMWIFPLGFLIIMLVFCLLVFRRGCCGPPWWHSSNRGGPGAETPLDILKRRYASGEISKDEFDRMKKDIEG